MLEQQQQQLWPEDSQECGGVETAAAGAAASTAAAEVLSRDQALGDTFPQEAQQPSQQQQQPLQSGITPVTILGVEHHSRPQQDFYSLTALLDFASFIYLALFYQVITWSCKSALSIQASIPYPPCLPGPYARGHGHSPFRSSPRPPLTCQVAPSLPCMTHDSASAPCNILLRYAVLLPCKPHLMLPAFPNPLCPHQVVMSSARSLADLTDEKQLPWDYLTALLLLFVITVVDRVVYSLGSHLGKALLLLGQLTLIIPLCMSLFWSPVAASSSSRARQHIRVFLVLKAASWVSSALQLRSGFPPRASFDGGGRQRFVFYGKADTWHLTGFYVFQVCVQGHT